MPGKQGQNSAAGFVIVAMPVVTQDLSFKGLIQKACDSHFT